MTRLIVPAVAVAVAMMLGGSPLWAQDKAETKAAMPEMKCAMMGGSGMAGGMAGMMGAPASETAAKLTAKKKELKLNDKQIQQIVAHCQPPLRGCRRNVRHVPQQF